MRRQAGFSIISAIFILVVLGALGAFMVTISGTQHQGVVLSLESSRAVAAARSGLEWGGYQALEGSGCSDTTFSLDEGVLAGFAITVTCTSTQHDERGDDVVVYEITATAERGTPGNRDYVRRRFRGQFVDIQE